MMERCRLCGLRKKLIDNLCERCQEIERLMGECLDPCVGLSNDCHMIPPGVNIIGLPSFGDRCDLDRSWMDNLPIKVFCAAVSSMGLPIGDSAVNAIYITPHEYAFIVSDELEADLGERTIKVILNNIIKLITLEALGARYSLLRTVAYDGSINTEGMPRINYPMLMALFYLDLDSQLQSLSLGKRIILIERVPWERLVFEDQCRAAYYSRYGVGIIGVGHDSGMARVPAVPMFRP